MCSRKSLRNLFLVTTSSFVRFHQSLQVGTYVGIIGTSNCYYHCVFVRKGFKRLNKIVFFVIFRLNNHDSKYMYEDSEIF